MNLRVKRDILAFLFLFSVFVCVFCVLFFSVFFIEVDRNIKIKLIRAEKYDQIKGIKCSGVIPYVYTKVPSLSGLSIKKRKEFFIYIVLPSVLIENFKMKNLRNKLFKLKRKMESGSLSEEEMEFLKKLCKKYKAYTVDDLLFKIDTIPVGLALAQAALESGWGTSRFFSEANNVFGRWLFGKGLGLRARDSDVRLKRFPSILDSVSDYFYNLNAGWAYESFRVARSYTKSSLHLAEYLEKYSILGKEYVARLKRLIKENNLDAYDECKIDSDYISCSFSIKRR